MVVAAEDIVVCTRGGTFVEDTELVAETTGAEVVDVVEVTEEVIVSDESRSS